MARDAAQLPIAYTILATPGHPYVTVALAARQKLRDRLHNRLLFLNTTTSRFQNMTEEELKSDASGDLLKECESALSEVSIISNVFQGKDPLAIEDDQGSTLESSTQLTSTSF